MDLLSFDPEERVHAQVSRRIRQMIRQKGLRKGDPLPGYRQLCKEFDVSSRTLREALKELYRENLIYSRRSKGIFVNQTPATERRALSQIALVYGCAHQTFFSTPYLMEVFQGVMLESDIKRLGVRIVSVKSQHKREGRLFIPKDVEDEGIDGVVLLSVNNAAYIKRFADHDFSVVAADYHVKALPVDTVVCDNGDAARRCVEHLVLLGHRHIAYVDGWATDSVAGGMGTDPLVETSDIMERRDGYRDAMRANGLTPKVFSNCPVDPKTGREEHTAQLAQALVNSKRPFTALLAYDTQVARALMWALSAMGMAVPQAMSIAAVMGAGDDAAHGMKLTYNRCPFVEMGRQCIRMLVESAGKSVGTKACERRVKSELVVGHTTKTME